MPADVTNGNDSRLIIGMEVETTSTWREARMPAKEPLNAVGAAEGTRLSKLF